MAISAVAMIIFQMVAFTRGDSHVAASGSSGGGDFTVVVVNISRFSLVPIISGAVGILLWIWPSRKPPKLLK
jgi:hypothetical protein